MSTELNTEANEGGSYGSATAAEGWRRGAAARADFLAALTQAMLDLADVAPGGRVLDVGAGAGEQSLIAAERAGPDGLVLATDISGAMLALLWETARELGIRTIRTQVVDARDLDVESDSFDAAICRNALMLM